MPTTEINLKQKNAPYLWSFFCFNLLAFLSFFFSTQLDAILTNFKSLTTLRTLGICIAPLLLFVINGLLTSEQKASLVFWRRKNVLPGNRAFTFHAKKDDRIDANKLAERYPKLPANEKEQNRLWYKIYKLNSNDVIVIKSHKDFLLARDMTSMAFLFLVFVGLPCLFIFSEVTKWYFVLMLTFQYALMVRIAQNHGRKFVRNVLAIESVKD